MTSTAIEASKSDNSTEPQLPFDNPFPNRWNNSNDGTSFEPCTAYSDSELSRFGVDPGAIKDAALVDRQGIRGCYWFTSNKYSLSVVVTNAESLEKYQSGMREIDWKPDLLIGGRTVGLADLNDDENTCSTYIQSGKSIVSAEVIINGGEEGRAKYDPCKIVIDFTAAYIEKIPE